jgi:chemotaxis methyl-accepting protein methylase
MATVQTSYAGNLALQQERWRLTLAEAQAALPLLFTGTGSYWHRHFLRPLRRALRANATHVTVYSAGCSTGELANVLAASQVTVARIGEHWYDRSD